MDGSRWILALLLRAGVTIVLVSSVAFWVVQVLPGDPAAVVVGIGGDPDAVAAIRRTMGLERPALVRYFEWLGGVVRGDLGESLVQGQPVSRLIRARLPVTATLAALALVTGALLGIAGALVGASGPRRRAAVRLLEYLAFAFPQFWIGLVLIYVFAVRLGAVPMFGVATTAAWILPTLSLAIPNAAILSRTIRGALEEIADSDHIACVRVLGIPRRRVLLVHALPLALLPATAVLAIQAGYLLAGTIVVEQVFSLPGLGRLALTAISQRDLPLIQGVTVVFGLAFPVMAAGGELVARLVWPHYRLGRETVAR